jgi:acetyl esterase/lipase
MPSLPPRAARVLVGFGLVMEVAWWSPRELGAGTRAAPVQLLDVALADTGGAPASDPAPADGRILGTEVRESPDPAFTVQRIRYQSAGIAVTAYVLRPSPMPDRLLPVIIYCRGGNGDEGAEPPLLKLGRLGAKLPACVIAPQYRGIRDGQGFDGYMGRDIEDVVVLDRVMEQLPGVDPARVALWGESRGGGMALHAQARMKPVLGCLVVGAHTDLREDPVLNSRPCVHAMLRFRIEGDLDLAFLADPKRHAGQELLFARMKSSGCQGDGVSLTQAEQASLANAPAPLSREAYMAELSRRSIVTNVAALKDRGAITILHGSADEQVHPGQSRNLSEALTKAGVQHEYVEIANGNHSLSGTFSTLSDPPAWVRDRTLPVPAADQLVQDQARQRIRDFFGILTR